MASKLNSLTRWLRDYRVLSRYRVQWMLACLFLLLAAAATLAVPLAFRGVVDTGLTSDAIDRQFIYLLILAAVLAVMTASRYYMMSWLGERVVADIRQRVFENVLRQSPRYFETLQTGEVLSRLTSDTTLVQTLVGSSISIAQLGHVDWWHDHDAGDECLARGCDDCSACHYCVAALGTGQTRAQNVAYQPR
jgi:ATP-binding cassette, subfamily B, bacterial